MEKIALAGLLPEEIISALSLSQQFRGTQIFEWIAKGAVSFGEMTNISASLRHELAQKAVLRSCAVSKALRDADGTVKLQIATGDALAIEAVLLTDKAGRKTACVSSQAGCPMKCAFCRTGTLGLARNLTTAEIVEQFLFLEKEAGMLDNIVFMGMGEPLLNLENVRKAITVLTDKHGRNLSSRRITVSTCGIIEKIYDLAENGPHVRLAVSLVTADEAVRKTLMPGAAVPLAGLQKAIAHYSEKSGRRVTLEAVLLSGVNTSKEAADSLIAFARSLNVHVNLIPWNAVPGLPFKTPPTQEIADFVSLLEHAGVPATVRIHRGRNVAGACGQLGKTNMPPS
ncbi:MAG: 23S rRNA (adenine(2503)-C(2))-methyltransferase RlmN [Treponema sp.]|nr:23S rRNA (adenine(2503)-C(2))-methyltransferase RlmN [Treponema sp.]